MSRVYGDPVQVTTSDDGRPTRFVWRGRAYAILRVLEHWVTTQEWWREDNPEAEDTGEREFWRVEARLDDEIGVYELRFDTTGRDWMLARVWD